MQELGQFSISLLPLTAMTDLLAYIGPGLGIGAIAVIAALLASILLAIFTIFWYPFKRFLRLFKRKRNSTDEAEQ